MGIRHQQKDEKHPYASPTTPGLFITFRAYLTELLCLNINSKLGPRFWSSDVKRWGAKFPREARSIANLSEQLDIDDALTQTALIETIKERNIRSLSHKKTLERVVKYAIQRRNQLVKQRMELSRKQQPVAIDAKKNSTFIDTGEKNTLAKVREVEHG